jgi:hypothetical protein
MRSKYLPWHTAGDKPKKVRCPDCPGSTRDRLEIKRLERKVDGVVVTIAPDSRTPDK